MPCRYFHQWNVREIVTVNIYQTYFHAFPPFPLFADSRCNSPPLFPHALQNHYCLRFSLSVQTAHLYPGDVYRVLIFHLKKSRKTCHPTMNSLAWFTRCHVFTVSLTLSLGLPSSECPVAIRSLTGRLLPRFGILETLCHKLRFPLLTFPFCTFLLYSRHIADNERFVLFFQSCEFLCHFLKHFFSLFF